LIIGPREKRTKKKKKKKRHFQCKMLYYRIKWKCERSVFIYFPFSIHATVIDVLDEAGVAGGGEYPVTATGYYLKLVTVAGQLVGQNFQPVLVTM
jgi:hypothetical protein